MGLFSWKCKHCSKSILSPYGLTRTNKWMNDAVAILENGSIILGSYDGYGGIGEIDVTERTFTMYHRACWEMEGKPSQFNGMAEDAPDQGHFYIGRLYNIRDPRLK